MLLLLLMGLGLAGASVALVARGAVLPKLRASETLGRISSYGFSSTQQEGETKTGAARNALDGVAAGLGSVAGRFSGFREASMRRELVQAGIYNLAPRKFLGYRVLCAICFPAFWIWLAVRRRQRREA